MLLIVKLHDFGLFWAVSSVIVGLYTEAAQTSRFCYVRMDERPLSLWCSY